mgnify:FL=1
MENVKIIPVITARKRPKPTFIQFLMGLWYMFLQLERRQRIHVGVAFLTITIPIGLMAFAAIQSVVETAASLPKPVQSVVSPVSLILPIPDPAPTIFPEEEEEVVPTDSKFMPVVEPVEQPLSKEAKKNKAFPVGVKELIPVSSIDYIEKYSNIAIGEMKKFGIPASISLAQGLIESRAGTSKLALKANNHFGMKCFSRNCRKGHCMNMTDDTHKDFFRKFSSPWVSWRAHSELISSGRYAKLKRHGKDYRAWAYGLKSAGYATDRTYAEKLIGIIERYDLHKYDR